MESYYWIMLQIHLAELQCEKEPGGPRDVPELLPWELWEPPGDPMRTPWAPPMDHKTIISQMYSNGSSRLLHPNPLFAPHHPNDSPDCIILSSILKNRAPFGLPCPAMEEELGT